jgi:hypothetical protein
VKSTETQTQTEKEKPKMKKLQNLTEPQKVIALIAPLPLVALVASVALLTYSMDFMSALFVVVSLLFIGAISAGVAVAVVKDEERITVQRTASRRIATLNNSLERATLNENGLLNLVRIVTIPSVGHMTGGAIHEAFRLNEIAEFDAVTAQLRAFVYLDGELTNDRLAWYAQAFHNGEGVGLNDEIQLDLVNEKVNYVLHGGDYVIPEPTYTHSATTALMMGTLDKAYTIRGKYGSETVYPLA